MDYFSARQLPMNSSSQLSKYARLPIFENWRTLPNSKVLGKGDEIDIAQCRGFCDESGAQMTLSS